MSKFASPYYPPRARWYSGVFTFGNLIRRCLSLDRIRLPRGVTMFGLFGSFLIPGLGFYLRGPRFWGKATSVIWLILFFLFVVWLGYPFGNCVFGLMLSLHAVGFIYYCSPYLAAQTFLHRAFFTLAVLMGIGLGLYSPIQHTVQNHWLMPLRNGNQVIIVSVQRSASLKRGDWAAFSTENGILFGQIAGLGGERIDSFTVPENHLLMHAQFARRYYHDGFFPMYTGRAEIFEQSVIVSPEELIGKPFKQWFWRKQLLP